MAFGGKDLSLNEFFLSLSEFLEISTRVRNKNEFKITVLL